MPLSVAVVTKDAKGASPTCKLLNSVRVNVVNTSDSLGLAAITRQFSAVTQPLLSGFDSYISHACYLLIVTYLRIQRCWLIWRLVGGFILLPFSRTIEITTMPSGSLCLEIIILVLFLEEWSASLLRSRPADQPTAFGEICAPLRPDRAILPVDAAQSRVAVTLHVASNIFSRLRNR